MTKILRTKPNFLPLINGVAFALHERGSISEDVSQEVADGFLQHDGYELEVIEKPAKAAKPAAKPKAAAKPKPEPEPEPTPEPESAAQDEPAAKDAPAADDEPVVGGPTF